MWLLRFDSALTRIAAVSTIIAVPIALSDYHPFKSDVATDKPVPASGRLPGQTDTVPMPRLLDGPIGPRQNVESHKVTPGTPLPSQNTCSFNMLLSQTTQNAGRFEVPKFALPPQSQQQLSVVVSGEIFAGGQFSVSITGGEKGAIVATVTGCNP